tara:strand:- start:115 stop:480 length:366 start_codon:yes stop_codon:yes gene_type:complete
MGPVEAFTTAWRKSFTYGGKATRSEYWWFYLIDLVVYFALLSVFSATVDTATVFVSTPIVIIYGIAQIFPSLSIVFRRLRDTGKEWTWIFINLIPIIGGIWFIYLLCQPSGKYEIGQTSKM